MSWSIRDITIVYTQDGGGATTSIDTAARSFTELRQLVAFATPHGCSAHDVVWADSGNNRLMMKRGVWDEAVIKLAWPNTRF